MKHKKNAPKGKKDTRATGRSRIRTLGKLLALPFVQDGFAPLHRLLRSPKLIIPATGLATRCFPAGYFDADFAAVAERRESPSHQTFPAMRPYLRRQCA